MKNLVKLTVSLFIILAILNPIQGQAFNPAAHIYIAGKVAKQVWPFIFDKTDFYYGTVAPDLSSYTDNWPLGFCETHYRYIRLPYPWWNLIQKAFAQGWQIHNEKWGADLYAHGNCQYSSPCSLQNCDYDGYVPVQAGILAETFSASTGNTILLDHPDLAHFAIEVAIDLLLVDHQDHA